ncbi:MAG: general secretion pathway protein GspB [Gammaproteobacteria bacterium]
MSFILDALRKSENARLRQEHPAMFDARPAASRRRFPAWFLALGLLLGLNLLALLYVLLRDERAAAAPVVAVPAATAPVDTNPVAPIPVARPRDVTRPAASAASTATVRPTTAPAAASAMTPPAVEFPARTRDDLLAAGDAVPETQVSLHVYDADPTKRFVFLNGQRLREGDVAANGLRVERIDADGVVLDHRGSDFKVPLEP